MVAIDPAKDTSQTDRSERNILLTLAVADLRVPRMGGEDLIRALRAERPGLPVVLGTGSAPLGGVEALRRNAGGVASRVGFRAARLGCGGAPLLPHEGAMLAACPARSPPAAHPRQ